MQAGARAPSASPSCAMVSSIISEREKCMPIGKIGTQNGAFSDPIYIFVFFLFVIFFCRLNLKFIIKSPHCFQTFELLQFLLELLFFDLETIKLLDRFVKVPALGSKCELLVYKSKGEQVRLMN